MHISSHLLFSRNKVYYFRIVIPKKIRSAFNNIVEFKYSLKTKDPVEAKYLVRGISYRIESLFRILSDRQGAIPVMDRDILRRTASYAVSFKTKSGTEITLQADTNIPKDHENLMELVKSMSLTDLISDSNQTAEPNNQQPQQTNYAFSINEVANKYFTTSGKKWSEKTLGDYQSIIGKFAEHHHNGGINTITSADIANYKVHLMTATNSNKALSARRVDFITSTINGFFKYAKSADYYSAPVLPTVGQKILSKADLRRIKGYSPLTVLDIATVLNHENMALHKKPHEFWFPLLGLYTGARLNELAQLTVTDIQVIDGIDVIHFTDSSHPSQHLKTEAARRYIPIHLALIKLGFLDYVENVRSIKGALFVFPYLTYYKGSGYGDVPGEAFARYLKKIGIQGEKKTFHSTRKTFNNSLRLLTTPEETRCQLLGHVYDSVNSSIYTDPDLLSKLKRIVDSVQYAEINLNAIQYNRAKFNNILIHEFEKKTRFLAHKSMKDNRTK